MNVLVKTLQWNGPMAGSAPDFGKFQKTLAKKRVKLHAKFLTVKEYMKGDTRAIKPERIILRASNLGNLDCI